MIRSRIPFGVFATANRLSSCRSQLLSSYTPSYSHLDGNTLCPTVRLPSLLGWKHFCSTSRSNSNSNDDGKNTVFTTIPTEWRKKQLENLENKFNQTLDIKTEDELQPMWKEMEGRVTRRKVRTLKDTGGKTGRMNVRKTDEDVWDQEGMYTATQKNDNNNKNSIGGEDNDQKEK